MDNRNDRLGDDARDLRDDASTARRDIADAAAEAANRGMNPLASEANGIPGATGAGEAGGLIGLSPAIGGDRASEGDRMSERTRLHDEPSAGDLVGEGVGGVSGTVAGAAIGSLGGPIGTLIGGIAGAVSGWWAGRAVSEAAAYYTDTHDADYRSHYESTPGRPADRSYDDVRPAYQLGHLAAHNPDYANKRFEEVEGDLKRGWSASASKAHGEWDRVRGYAHEAYSRGTSRLRESATPRSGAAPDNARDRVAGRDTDLDTKDATGY